MDDVSSIDIVFDGTETQIETALPAEMTFYETHAEFVDNGRLIMIKTRSEVDALSMGVAMGCVMVSANMASTEIYGSNLAVTILKGVSVIGSILVSKASVTMTVSPIVDSAKNAIGSFMDTSASIAITSSTTGLSMARVGFGAAGEAVAYLRGWTLTNIISAGCTTTLVGTGSVVAAVIGDKAYNGRDSTRAHDTIVPIVNGITDETQRILLDLGLPSVSSLGEVVKTVYDETLSGVRSALVIGALATVSIVLVNQSKFNWAGLSDQPAPKRRKK
jgi:hypothetical protein